MGTSLDLERQLAPALVCGRGRASGSRGGRNGGGGGVGGRVGVGGDGGSGSGGGDGARRHRCEDEARGLHVRIWRLPQRRDVQCNREVKKRRRRLGHERLPC